MTARTTSRFALLVVALVALTAADAGSGSDEADDDAPAAAPEAPDAGPPDAGVALPARDPAEAKKLLGEEKAKLNAIVDKQESLLDALDGARSSAREAESAARDAEAAEKKARVALVQATADADAAEAALEARITALRPRLAARYRLTHGGTAALLLNSASISDLLWRRRTLTRVLGADLELLRAAKSERARLLAAQQAKASAEQELAQRREAMLAKALDARHKRDELDALVKALAAQREAKEKLVQELAEAASHLDSLAAAPAVFTPKLAFEKLKGRLPMPAAGHVEVGFGRVVDPQFGTVLVQKGVDLRAEQGTVVQAVAAGRVVHAAALRGYGNLVILDQGQGFFTLYAHLMTIEHAVGDVLNPGDRVGAVGDTGSLKGAYLYFEIRHHGTPLNPADWLRK
ncbi:MAG: peptidoglycan DD-metalloendopeptidase family protein [Deltaproteobacteria bacterium]|nr:peptidoglycan DD-metalloendopeptidase family protein [Deltaproteobacteria bacterium]